MVIETVLPVTVVWAMGCAPVRGRWLARELNGDSGLVDYSLGLGWRF
jgi:hypothetical protein